MTTKNHADDANGKVTLENQLRDAIDVENMRQARELAANLWDERDATHVEVIDLGDCGTVEVTKDGFLGQFSVDVDREGYPRASEIGFGVFERHDDRGYHLIEDVEIVASGAVFDEMTAGLDAAVDQYHEQQARRREYRRMVL